MAKILVLGAHAESLINFRKEMLTDMARTNQVIACVPDASATVVEQLNNMGVEYRNIQLARTGLNPFADLISLKALYKLFKSLEVDQVFTYTSKPVIFGSIAARLAGVKQKYAMITGLGSYFIHTDIKSLLIRSIMSVLYKISLSFNTKVFFQNTDDVNDFRRFGIFNDLNRTVMINGSGVNIDHFQPVALPANKISFLLTARLIKAKGIFEYLAAAQKIKQKYPHVEFLLVGWFEDKDEALNKDQLQAYIDNNTITFLGKLTDIRLALAQTSIYVLPSYREGTPRSVLEAMASGRPIITTDVPGCRATVIDGDNGFLVPAKNVDALCVAMERFINNPGLIAKMGQRSREIALEKYDVNKVNKVILDVIGQNHVS